MFNTQQGLKDAILKAANEEVFVRVYFKNTERSPITGKFIILDDFTEMFNKSYIRFLPNSKVEMYEIQPMSYFTRLLLVTEILDFKIFCNGQIC